MAREEQRGAKSSWVLFSLGIAVVYLLLAALYGNFLDPLIIPPLTVLLLALVGALAGLWMLGLPLDVYAQMGLLVLVSLAAKNGILAVEFANQKLKAGFSLQQAIHDAAAVQRIRPILLTTVTSLAGFLPLLLSTGAGTANRISMGTVVFSGLPVSTVLSLSAPPSIYLLMKQRRT